mmetsp:Transcript_32951/g.81912  ORF Transcript_32951/g.81912 Transcript_32951/m.81912 type:complete len:201 (+) Transcript_32951:895-1497(+)
MNDLTLVYNLERIGRRRLGMLNELDAPKRANADCAQLFQLVEMNTGRRRDAVSQSYLILNEGINVLIVADKSRDGAGGDDVQNHLFRQCHRFVSGRLATCAFEQFALPEDSRRTQFLQIDPILSQRYETRLYDEQSIVYFPLLDQDLVAHMPHHLQGICEFFVCLCRKWVEHRNRRNQLLCEAARKTCRHVSDQRVKIRR